MDILETNPRYKKSSLGTVRNTVSKLLPFFMSCCVYFVLWIPLSEPSPFSAFIKCLPIISLEFFIVVHSISQKNFSSYARKIFVGLIFSGLGDMCLIWPEYFLHGMVMFGLAHLTYIFAFGFRPLRKRIFIVLALFCVTFYVVALPYLNGPFVYMVGGYSVLIGTMAWRALAKVSLASYNFSWAHISAAVGSIDFMISDCVLAIDKFCFPISNARTIVMGTYYSAQLLIALSVTGYSQDDFMWKSK
ncbi:lysoplasmalogenase [Spea bombifrons]|uniref:lysoplasmalogenase n=1 Tax=Spea bombifrons TaxID=233779 RepID=UPI00234B5BC1|nr:lysoplasmalogenase [Spea bombifrons]